MEKRNESLCATKPQNPVISERYSYLFYTFFFSFFMSCAHNKIYFFRQLPNEHNFRESPNIDQECCVECERERRAKRINLIQRWPSFHVCAACCLCNRNVWRLFIIFFIVGVQQGPHSRSRVICLCSLSRALTWPPTMGQVCSNYNHKLVLPICSDLHAHYDVLSVV